jgi:hypothetical protein
MRVEGRRAGEKSRQGDDSMVVTLPPTSKSRDEASRAVGVSGALIDRANAIPEGGKSITF